MCKVKFNIEQQNAVAFILLPLCRCLVLTMELVAAQVTAILTLLISSFMGGKISVSFIAEWHVNVAILKNYDFIFAPNATTILCHQNCMNTVTLPHRSSCVSGNGDIIEAVEGNPMASVYFTSSRRRPLT